jgi:hypothetical protein
MVIPILGTSLDKVYPMVVPVTQGMFHTMLLRNLAVIATTDVPTMIVKARNKLNFKANLQFRHLRQDTLHSTRL